MQIVVMGPAGSGAALVGASVAAALHGEFIDGDDLHGRAALARLRRRVPLEEGDRLAWLDAVARALDAKRPRVVACPLLLRPARDRLRTLAPGVVFVELVPPVAEGARAPERTSWRERRRMRAGSPRPEAPAPDPLTADEPGVRVADDADLGSIVERITTLLAAR